MNADLPRAAIPLVLDHIADGLLVCDMRRPGHPIIHVNEAFVGITGFAPREAIGQNARYLQGTDRQQPAIELMRSALADSQPCAVVLRNYRRDGRLFKNALKLVPISSAVGTVTHYMGLMRDVTSAPGTDRLTGALDRYGFVDVLSTTPAAAGTHLVVIVDVVRFHEINSGFGYSAADALLCSIVQRLSTLPALAVARLGVDSFAIAFTLSDVDEAEERLRELAATLAPRFLLPGADLSVRFATGYAMGGPETDAHSLIRRAAAALQQSASSPIPRPQAFDAAAEQAARNRVRLTAELQGALAAEEFLFHYQPQIDLASGALVGAEALLRWNHGVFGMQPPGRFIGLAEQTGLMLDIGAWGLATVARFAAKTNRGRARPIRFSFNVSIAELMERDMLGLLRQVLADTGCRPEWLTFELTENLMATHADEIVRMFKALREFGIGLSIDDFGTGYSNFGYLEAFSVSEIKIDRSFVEAVSQSATKRLIVESIVKLGKALDIPVVAEGIERESDLAVLREMGCPIGQGYLFARPMEEAAFERLMDRDAQAAGHGGRLVPVSLE